MHIGCCLTRLGSIRGLVPLLLLLGAAPVSAQSNEFRAFWVDAWGAGIWNASQVTQLINDTRAGNLNAVIPQVRRRGDAFYNSNYEPRCTDMAAGFDSLADLISKAHNTNSGQQRIEVHAWLVMYHIWATSAGALPPQPDHPLNLHPDWLLKDINGNTLIGGQYTFDPGHPAVQEHTFNVCMDIITNYNVDGLNFDYIRYSSINEGYNEVTVERFNRLFGRTGQPSPSDPVWKQFRRDQITGLLRKIYLNVIAVKPHVKISCDTITWAPGPTSDSQWYSSSAAWNSVLQDWRGWMEEGIMDLNIPMNYFRQWTHPTDYVNWSTFAKNRRFNRHLAIGPGIYLNSVEDAIAQMRHTREPTSTGNKADGVVGYSYRVTNKDGVSRANFLNALVNPSVYDPITPPIFAQKVPVPEMPWKTAPTKGHVKGTIYGGGTTNRLDGARITITGPLSRAQTNDATGFYGFVDLNPGTYTITATFPGYMPQSTNVTVTSGVVSTRDLVLPLTGPPAIIGQPQSQTVYAGTVVNLAVSATGPEPLHYQWRHNGGNLPGANSPILTWNPIAGTNAGDYVVVITNSFGAVTSQVATLEVIVPPPNKRLIQLWNLAPGARPYLSTGSTERGLAYNAATGRLLLVSRASTPQVFVMNADSSADLHQLNLGAGVISGGTFTMNMIGAADDGAIYVCNLTTSSATTPFKIYRWANDGAAATPTLAYSGDPVPGGTGNELRWGDTFDVRGAGPNTQILVTSRTGTRAVVFTTSNGSTFTPHFINVPNLGGGLGASFGADDTFWTKDFGGPLRQASFNLSTGAGAVLRTHSSPAFPNSIMAIDIGTNLNLLAGIAIETPDNLKLYDLTTDGSTPVLIETNSFAADNDNLNRVGSVDFKGVRVFALNANNGIVALQILPPPMPPIISQQPQPQSVAVDGIAGFSVSASGTEPLGYQWWFNNSPIGAATSSDYTRMNVQAADAGNYWVVVTNVAGTVTSAVATLTVLVPPQITSEPDDITLTAGQNAVFHVSAAGSEPLHYQWRRGETNIPGATAGSFTVTNAQHADAGLYSVVVTNVAGAIASRDALLTVNVPPLIIEHPGDQSVKPGTNVSFTVVASGTAPLSYQWRFNGTNLPGANGAVHVVEDVQPADAGQYLVMVSNVAGVMPSAPATLSVLPFQPPEFRLITSLPDGRVHLVWTGEPERAYTLESSSNLVDWFNLTDVDGTNGVFETVDDAASNHLFRFYRVRE